MEKHIIQKLLEKSADNKLTTYSGRGMFGQECLAVVTEQSMQYVCADLIKAAGKTLSPQEQDELVEALRSMRQDQLRRDSCVFYFPGIKYVNDEDLDEKLDEVKEALDTINECLGGCDVDQLKQLLKMLNPVVELTSKFRCE